MSSPISGFTAIPNPQMLAFMPIQSYLMMYFAGSGWQYGKRKISAMSNEQFNKLTPEELLKQHSIELKNMLPTLERSLNDVTPLVRILIEQYGDFIKAALQAIPQAVSNAGIPILTGHAKEDYDKDAFDFLKNLFPSLPKAEGHTETVQPTISSSMLQQQARDKQLAFEEEQARLKALHIQLVKSGDVTTPTVTAPILGAKKAAGQSQIIERNFLIGKITYYGNQLKTLASYKNDITSSGKPSSKQVGYNQAVAFMKDFQQRLVDLLNRYQF